jgi:hypothetical protein
LIPDHGLWSNSNQRCPSLQSNIATCISATANGGAAKIQELKAKADRVCKDKPFTQDPLSFDVGRLTQARRERAENSERTSAMPSEKEKASDFRYDKGEAQIPWEAVGSHLALPPMDALFLTVV